MSTTSAGLMTVAEFERLPERLNGARQELRHGEVIELPPPKPRHADIQRRLTSALNRVAGQQWIVDKETAFRPHSDHDAWIADVAVVASERWNATVDTNTYLSGAPELVAEVLSPSNIASELYERLGACLEAGCREFWIVDPETREIRVSTPDRLTRTYRKGEQIEVALLGGTLAVDDVL